MCEAMQALTAQLALLQEVLQGKVRAYSTLQTFPTRVWASARVAQLSARMCAQITEVPPCCFRTSWTRACICVRACATAFARSCVIVAVL